MEIKPLLWNIDQPLTPELIELLRQPIDELALSLPTKIALLSGGIYHIKSLVTQKRVDLLELSQMNRQSVAEVLDVLSQRDLYLDMRIPWSAELENLQVSKRIPTFEETEFFFQSIEVLNFSTRTNNILTKSRIYNIGDLVTKTEQAVKSIPNLGKQSFTEIQGTLVQKNLQFGMRIEWPLSPEKLHILTKPLTPDEIKFFSQSIEVLNLPFRNTATLNRNGIYNLGDLVIKTEKDLLRTVRRFGKTSLSEVKEALSEIDLHLGMMIEWPPATTKPETLSQQQTFINNRRHRTLDNQEKPPVKIYYYGKTRAQ